MYVPLEKKPIYLFVISLGLIPSELVALHFPKIHDEIQKQITICNDNYKFDAYPHNILQKIAVKNMMIVTIHSVRFSLGTVSQLLAQRIRLSRVLRRLLPLLMS